MLARLRKVDPRLVVALSAVAAVVLRFPGLLYPLGSDEAGFTLVAREWHPQPTSLYGAYWVDRPPPLIALIKVSDAIGGPLFIRLVAALGAGALVVAAAATTRQMLRFAGETDTAYAARTGAWTAVLTAALTSSAMIDPVMAKGEILGIPLVVASFWLGLRALNRTVEHRPDLPALALAAGAGFLAVLAQGLKQNLVAGLVFGVAMLVGARVRHRITTAALLRLSLGALAGGLVPVVATVGWALWNGVLLHTLWYAVYGFRSDALEVITAQSQQAPASRALVLLGIALASGAAFVLAGVLLHRRRVWRFDPVLTVATLTVVLVDTTSLVLSGSFWRPYLFALVPGVVLCAALLLAVRDYVARRTERLVVAAVVVSLAATAVWTVWDYAGVDPPDATRTGLALHRAAEPDDTVVVYGGHAELVLASGLRSPYRHLWTLPMRTLDPDLSQLQHLLEGPDAPTWFILWLPESSWGGLAAPIMPVLLERYQRHGETCGGHPVYLLDGEQRPELDPRCDGRGSPFLAPSPGPPVRPSSTAGGRAPAPGR